MNIRKLWIRSLLLLTAVNFALLFHISLGYFHSVHTADLSASSNYLEAPYCNIQISSGSAFFSSFEEKLSVSVFSVFPFSTSSQNEVSEATPLRECGIMEGGLSNQTPDFHIFDVLHQKIRKAAAIYESPKRISIIGGSNSYIIFLHRIRI